MANQNGERVMIEIRGPKLSWGDPLVVLTHTNITWDQLFRQECGMIVYNNYRISTSQFRRRNPGQNRGRSFGVNELISDFVNGFRSRRRIYKAIIFNVNERRGRGIRVHPPRNRQLVTLQNQTRARLLNVSEQFLRRVQGEVQELIRNGSWQRSVRMAPMTCQLVQEILQQE